LRNADLDYLLRGRTAILFENGFAEQNSLRSPGLEDVHCESNEVVFSQV